jgi:hypothetical protein
MLAELLGETDIDQFESYEDLVIKLGPVFETESDRRNVGLIGHLKKTFLGK